MKFTLKDYQRDAVRDALTNLKKGRRFWQGGADKTAFSLTAVTGAGKTVMAAAAFEALFHGDDEFDFDADQGAVVIWFSDDPALNEQTRFRLMEASDRTWKNHLLCDKDGKYPAVLNDWERRIVETEAKRDGFAFWYRNPQQPGQSSLGIAYADDSEYKIVRPDFLFFTVLADGQVVTDIVDPHGLHLADALPKLKGLASYAETHAKAYRRIESVAKIGDKLRVLDMTRDDVRSAIAKTTSAQSVFLGSLADDYQ